MLENLFRSGKRAAWVEHALAQYLEDNMSWPRGTLSGGIVSLVPGKGEYFTFVPGGGVVCCSDQDLAECLIAEVGSDKWEDGAVCLSDLAEIVKAKTPDAPDNRYVVLYQVSSSKINVRKDIVAVTAEEAIPNRNPSAPKPELVLAIRDDSTIISHATIFEPMCVLDDRPFYELGVTTHPDYRRKGLARDMVNAALEYVASRNGVAVWKCKVANEASIGLARALGFTDFSWTLDWGVYSS